MVNGGVVLLWLEIGLSIKFQTIRIFGVSDFFLPSVWFLHFFPCFFFVKFNGWKIENFKRVAEFIWFDM